MRHNSTKGADKTAPVRVDGTRHHHWACWRLSGYGLRPASSNAYRGVVRMDQIRGLQRYCKKAHLTFSFNNAYGRRSATYRTEFFSENPPPIRHQYYFCAYCGRLVSAQKITIDHLYPVGEVSRNLKLQKKLKKRGILSVNDIRNLVPACARCNERKGKKMGRWILRGRIGRHPSVWVIRHIFRCLLAFGVFTFLIWLLMHPEEASMNLTDAVRQGEQMAAEWTAHLGSALSSLLSEIPWQQGL